MAIVTTGQRRERERRTVTVLGSTGSIGRNTLDLVRREPEAFAVDALTGNRNIDLLIEQALEFRPKLAVVADPAGYASLKAALSGTGIEVAAGDDAVVAAAERPVEWVMAAIVGAAGLAPTLAAVRRGAIVGLANKECLVCAGDLLVGEIHRHGATLIPVDSEHSAIYQVFDFDSSDKVESVILTASGGPFRTASKAHMGRVTPAEAVAHPNWSMGAKISVDSATMMNKGLELIEAFHLFPVDEGQIEIVVHPQSVVHSMVAYVDGSVLAQLGTPDMRTPIAYALAWPNRMATPAPRLDFREAQTLTFEPPDKDRFPALALARRALQSGGTAPTILNAANEVAVDRFLNRRLGFLDIAHVVAETLERMPVQRLETLADVSEADQGARETASRIADRIGERVVTTASIMM